MTTSVTPQPCTPHDQWVAATQKAIVFDVSNRSRMTLSGKDRLAFLHRFCTNDINNLPDGRGCEAFLLNVKGRILGHCFVFSAADDLYLDGSAGQCEFLMQHLAKYQLLDDVRLTNTTETSRELLLTGPLAAEALQTAFPDQPPLEDGCCRVVAASDRAASDRAASDRAASNRSGSDCVIIKRIDFLDQPTVLLSTDVESLPALLAKLNNLTMGTTDVLEGLRVQAGYPIYGADLSDDNLAQEAGRTARAISFTKGCYLGQEPVARIHAMGHVNRELRRFVLRGDCQVAVGTEIRHPKSPDKTIGTLTSVARNYETGVQIALGMVRSQFAESGMELPLNLESPATALVQ
jgi:tRNA-modifying protein YgfZ